MTNTLQEKQSYKKTELGLIPEDWSMINLYEVRNKNDRYSFTGGPFGSDLKSKHYTKQGVRIIQLQNIGEGEFIDNYAIYTSEQKADELKSCNIYPNEIILAKMDPVARACLIPKASQRYLMCSDGIRLSVDKELFDNKYIFYALNSSYFRNSANSRSTGTTRKRIGLSELKTLLILIPLLPEQQKIAEILSTVDEKIESIDQQIEHTTQLKKGLMQKLLTQGIGHTEFKDSPLGRIPACWEIDVLGEHAYIKARIGWRGLSASEYTEHGPYLIAGTHIKDSNILWENCDHISDYRYKESKEIQLQEQDIVISKDGTIGRVGLIENMPGKATINGTMMLIRMGTKLFVPKFIYHYLQGDYFKKLIKEKISGSSVPHLFQRDMVKLKITIPPIEEQQKIADILSTADKKIETLQNKKSEYEQLKKGLMQKLLTGQIRVKV